MSSADLIIEYSGNPPNKRTLSDADICYKEANRVCADVVEVFLKFKDDTISEFGFD